jgi:diguanylate cyclase (GGDEF)-like protein
MKLTLRPLHMFRADWSDWGRPATRDVVVVLGVTVLASLAAHFYDLPPKVFQFAIDRAEWEMDDLIFVVFILNIAMLICGVRRYREAQSLARHDPLTGLPNRRLFSERLDECLRDGSDKVQTAVLMLDLDGFKRINDTHGHAVGDKALCEFSQRVSVILRADSVLARIGGDEFGIIMPEIRSLDDPPNLARRIVASAAETFAIEDVTAELGVGVGIAIAPNDGANPEELVRRADRALYRAKGDGRSRVRFFEPEMDSHVERRNQLEQELRIAIATDAVKPHYQPLVSLEGDRIIGFEALARWESKAFGAISPEVFIPIAEEVGLINALGDQLFRRACLDANAWPGTFTLAFNVSPIQLRDPALGLRVLSILGQTGFQPAPSGDRDHRERPRG